MNYQFTNDLAHAKKLDEKDPLAKIRDHFYIKPGQIYMDGNSLGLASKEAVASLQKMTKVWQDKAIGMWDEYFHYGQKLGDECGKLINAQKNEVLITGSTTSNVHQCVSTLYQPTNDRYKILVDDLNFPTDRYAIDSEVRLKGYDPNDAVKVVKSPDGKYIDEDAVINAMTPDVTLILLPTVLYRSAQVLNMERLTQAAHQRNIIIGWDLCHAIGAIKMDFQKIQPDFAIWCTYKYLNGGPGSVAGMYLNSKHFDKNPGLAGWWGNRDDTQFQLKNQFEHQKDVSGWQIGTPTMLGMAPLEGSLKLINEVGIDQIRAKSLKITAYLMYLIDEKLTIYGCKIGNPREDSKRGGHVCLEHPNGYQISLALKDYQVIPDFREPDVIRLAPIALYTSYQEVYQLVEILENILKNKIYEKYSNKRGLVV